MDPVRFDHDNDVVHHDEVNRQSIMEITPLNEAGNSLTSAIVPPTRSWQSLSVVRNIFGLLLAVSCTWKKTGAVPQTFDHRVLHRRGLEGRAPCDTKAKSDGNNGLMTAFYAADKLRSTALWRRGQHRQRAVLYPHAAVSAGTASSNPQRRPWRQKRVPLQFSHS